MSREQAGAIKLRRGGRKRSTVGRKAVGSRDVCRAQVSSDLQVEVSSRGVRSELIRGVGGQRGSHPECK